MGYIRQGGTPTPNRLEGRRVVERGEHGELVDRPLDRVVDDDRLHKAPPAVHDPMPDRVGPDESLDPFCGLSTNQVELETGRPSIDDEHVHEGSFA